MPISNLNPLTNGSYWGPTNLPPGGILAVRWFLLAGYVNGLGFAAQFVIYVAVMRILWSRRKVIRTTWTLMTHSTAMCLVNLLMMISSYISIEKTFIENINFPGGSLVYIGVSTELWFRMLIVACAITGNVLCDVILLWRCHVIWRVGNLGSKVVATLVMILPTMMLIASIGIGIAWIIASVKPVSFLDPDVRKLSIAYFSISITLNILLTLMIIFRMKMYQKEIKRCVGSHRGAIYTSVSTIFIESAGLWTLVSLPLFVTIIIQSPLSEVFAGIVPPTQICSSYFIIWRVADGRAWSKNMMLSSLPISDLEFKQSNPNSLPPHDIGLSGEARADEVRMEGDPSSGPTLGPSLNGMEHPITSGLIVDNDKKHRDRTIYTSSREIIE